MNYIILAFVIVAFFVIAADLHSIKGLINDMYRGKQSDAELSNKYRKLKWDYDELKDSVKELQSILENHRHELSSDELDRVSNSHIVTKKQEEHE